MIDNACVVCPKCGKQVAALKSEQPNIIINNSNENTNINHNQVGGYGRPKDKWISFFLCLFLGIFGGHKVFSEAEIKSRCEIMLDNYRKTVHIEAQTMIDMARREILPAVERYAAKLAEGLAAKKAVAPGIVGRYEAGLITHLSGLADQIDAAACDLNAALAQ